MSTGIRATRQRSVSTQRATPPWQCCHTRVMPRGEISPSYSKVLLSQLVHLHRLVHGSSYTLHVRFPLTQFFFFAGAVNKLKDCLWSRWKSHPVHLIELPSHLPAMIDWRRNVWVTLQASPVHCSLGACPLNMFVQRVLVWRQVSLRISARLEQCSPGLINFLRGQSIEVIGQ